MGTSQEEEKTEFEARLIRAYLEVCGYSIADMQSGDKPDMFVTLRNRRSSKRVGIEQTEYYNDRLPGERLALDCLIGFWEKVQCICVDEISKKHDFPGVLVSVRFDESSIKKGDCREIIKNPRVFVGSLIQFITEQLPLNNRSQQFRKRDFNAFDPLRLALTSIRVLCDSDLCLGRSVWHWKCANLVTGYIGLDSDGVMEIVKQKNEKQLEYNWGDVDEKWLLITASGTWLSPQMGPIIVTNNIENEELRQMCEESGFDRIILWECVRKWYKSLKPWGDAVKV